MEHQLRRRLRENTWKGGMDILAAENTENLARINAVIDGLAVQMTVHEKVLSRTKAAEWVRLAAAREVGIDPSALQ